MDVDPIPAPLVASLTDGERRRRDTARAKRQFNMRESEAAAEKRDSEEEASRAEAEEEDNGAQSVGSAFNPENPYHVSDSCILNIVPEVVNN